MDNGHVPADRKGEPGIGISAPSAPILKAETVFDPPFGTYRNRPPRSTVTEVGPPGAPYGEPGSGTSAPAVSIVNPEIELVHELTAYRRPRVAVIGPPTACRANGEPGTGLS